ncbi:MAG TPA: hypothetical protein PLS53_16025 [Thermoanaerobaculaceae bacterium]|nr:hypothetical protein [Thermoanaerobaculaceae bacterium]HPS79666.1 hypothetical protein [Thermoanaerobaculaceae bacterium]
MRSRYGIAVMALVAMLGLGCRANIPETKARKVTGRVVKANDSVLVLQVGAEQWELKVMPATQLPPDLKQGSAVTVEYAMVAKVATTRPEPPKSAKPTPRRAE